jgi:hypothetical protein
MADESAERRAPLPGCSDQPAPDGGPHETNGASDRRRVMIASLLAAPAVITLNVRSARAKNGKKDPSPSCTASLTANPGTSHHCQ